MLNFVNILKELDLPILYAVAEKGQQLPYIVYTNYSEYYNKADNRINEVVTSVQLDYYTNTPFDEKRWGIRQILDENGITFAYKMLYDNTEKVYHHIWDCEVV